MNHKELVRKLRRDVKKNINVINFIESYPVDRVDQVGGTIRVSGKSDHDWNYISSDSKDEFQDLLESLGNEKYFAILEDWMVPLVEATGALDWKLSCVKFSYPESKSVPLVDAPITPLSIEDAEWIFKNGDYSKFTSTLYIREMIQKGPAIGIRQDGNLVAWVMTHDDGAIGFLHVLPEYRSRGYAIALTCEMIRRVKRSGKIAFVHIEEENKSSIRLAKKLGFEEERKVHWIKLK
jgi:8-oxo-dGTP diphosphatase